jgi:hypothetical protein
MPNDLSSFKKGDIIQNELTKKLFLVTSSETLTIRRVKLLNISDLREETIEGLADRPLVISYDNQKAPYLFRYLDFNFVSDYLLDNHQTNTLKNYLEFLGERQRFQAERFEEDTPRDKILKTTDIK